MLLEIQGCSAPESLGAVPYFWAKLMRDKHHTKQGIAEDQKSPPHEDTLALPQCTRSSPSMDYSILSTALLYYVLGYHSLRAIEQDHVHQYLELGKHQNEE
jgi:hypothetical protein